MGSDVGRLEGIFVQVALSAQQLALMSRSELSDIQASGSMPTLPSPIVTEVSAGSTHMEHLPAMPRVTTCPTLPSPRSQVSDDQTLILFVEHPVPTPAPK